MVKCSKCGEEYSLGRKIYHECKEYSIFHGAVCSERCIEHPWNCNSNKKLIPLQLEINDYLTNDEKYIDTFNGYLSSFIFFF
ncbi:MAG: hypothetical protein ACFE94_05230 [Candidatus Hodarchaeota archaeon]